MPATVVVNASAMPEKPLEKKPTLARMSSGKSMKRLALCSIRNGIVESWLDGRPCVLRLGAAMPDFAMLIYKHKDAGAGPVVPLDLFEAVNMQPGPLNPSLYPVLASFSSTHAATPNHAPRTLLSPPCVCAPAACVRDDAESTGRSLGTPKNFVIKDGFKLVLSSALSMHTYAKYTRGRLPLHWLQPVQVCSSRSQVAAVLRDPTKAVPNEDVDGIMDRLDALADAL